MKYVPKVLRILASAVSFATALAVFSGLATCPWWVALQPGPAILRFAGTFSSAAAASLAGMLLFAWIFGRFFCSFVCPLGTLQDIAGALSFRPARPDRNRKRLRAAILIAALFLLAGTSAILWRLLDPYSMFGSIATLSFAPFLSRAAAALSASVETIPFQGWTALISGALIPFLCLVGLSVWKKRIYCTSVCPVGTLLGFCAKNGLFRLQIDSARCVRCAKCIRVCPASAIELNAGVPLDNERCVRCMNCIAVCPKQAVRYAAKKPVSSGKKPDAPPADPKRREFLSFALLAGGSAALGAGLNTTTDSLSRKKGLIFPPGAGSQARFAARCTNCGRCLARCTGKVITAPTPEKPFLHIEYHHSACEFECRNCIEACPTDALNKLDLDQKKRCRIGLIEFEPDLCIAVREDTDCGACAEHCPTGALRMVQESDSHCPVPTVHSELCIGCGKCIIPCPKIALHVNPVSVQSVAEDPVAFFERRTPAPETPSADIPAESGDGWLI